MALENQNFIVLPGDTIDPSLIPTHKKLPLRLGPGLRHIPPSEIVPTVAGQLVTDRKKNSIWVEYNGGHVRNSHIYILYSCLLTLLWEGTVLRSSSNTHAPRADTQYIPSQGDLVIGQIHHSGPDVHYVSVSPHAPNATLPQLAFESATKKTKPVLAPGQLVYARVALANRHMDPELECVSPSTGRADGLGPLIGGCVFAVSLGFARRLLMPPSSAGGAAGGGGVEVLEMLGAEGLAFETAVGRNGKVWVGSEDVKTIIVVGRVLKETDEGNLTVDAQRKLVKRLLKGMR